jgi:hypothetical protein
LFHFTSTAADAAAGGGNYFWLDVFALDQQKREQSYTSANEHDAWEHRDETLATVRAAVTSIGRTVAYLDPPTRPLLVTRKWCMYELMQTIVSDSDLILCVTPEPPDIESMSELLSDLDMSITAFTPSFEDGLTTHDRDKNWYVWIVLISFV